MFNKATVLFFLLSFLTLTSCVSIPKNNQSISNFSNISDELHSCELANTSNVTNEKNTGLNPDNISFLNWNIYKGNGDRWQDDLSSFATNHHLMTIQEASLSKEMASFLQKYDFSWIMNATFHSKDIASGVMNIASTHAMYSCGFKVNEPFIRVPKAALVSYYYIENSQEILLVANIHGINFTPGMNSYRYQLNNLYNAVKHHEGPMIVAGDFNSWSDNRMLAVNELVKILELSKLEYPVNNKTHIFGKSIDHVFYRQLIPFKYKVQQVSSSDHNPISVNFKLQSRIL